MQSPCKAQEMGKDEKDLKRLGYRARRPKFLGSASHEKKWVKLDSQGKKAVVGVDRQRLTQQLGIQLRDLRILDPKFNTSYPSAILCRENALVVNLEHIKAIISPSYVFVMNPETDGVVEFIKDLEERLCREKEMKRSISCPSLKDIGHNNAAEEKKKSSWTSGNAVSLKGWVENNEESSVRSAQYVLHDQVEQLNRCAQITMAVLLFSFCYWIIIRLDLALIFVCAWLEIFLVQYLHHIRKVCQSDPQ